jgi:hypothetical protein
MRAAYIDYDRHTVSLHIIAYIVEVNKKIVSVGLYTRTFTLPRLETLSTLSENERNLRKFPKIKQKSSK